MKEKKAEIKALYNQLDVCGQILGDGDSDNMAHYRREYKRICKQLARLEPENWPIYKRDNAKINGHIAEWCESHTCPKCGGKMKQTRSGAFRVICLSCNTKFQFKHKHI